MEVPKYQYLPVKYSTDEYKTYKDFKELFNKYGSNGWRVVNIDCQPGYWQVLWEYPVAYKEPEPEKIKPEDQI